MAKEASPASRPRLLVLVHCTSVVPRCARARIAGQAGIPHLPGSVWDPAGSAALESRGFLGAARGVAGAVGVSSGAGELAAVHERLDGGVEGDAYSPESLIRWQ